MYQGTPYAVEPDPTARTVFIASMMHVHLAKRNISVEPDITCSNDVLDHVRRDEVGALRRKGWTSKAEAVGR